MDYPKADLRTLYQAYSSQIEFSKTQLWRVVNYGIWAIAGIMGLFQGFADSGWAIAFPAMIIAVFFICFYNIVKCWRSMREGRIQFIKIRHELSPMFRCIHKKPRYNYEFLIYDAWIVIPLILVMFVGSFFACVLLITKLKKNGIICSVWQWPEMIPSMLIFAFCFFSFLLFLFRLWFKFFDSLFKKCGRRLLRFWLLHIDRRRTEPRKRFLSSDKQNTS